MIDLHLHLDGSLSPELVLMLAKAQGITLPAENVGELKGLLTVGDSCQNLNDYLKCFDLPLSLLQTGEAISLAVSDLVSRLNDEGLIYAEIRFAPQLHMKNGLGLEEVVNCALSGLNDSIWKQDVRPNLILCMMRGDGNRTLNMETVRLAKKYGVDGVAAVDLAGAETIYPTEDFADCFRLANDLGVPLTIHAGEAAGADSVETAAEFGARRIGHGVRAAQSEKTVEMILEKGVFLEMCPTSNLQTRAVESIERHPVAEFLRRGLPVTLNTDNMTVSDTTCEKEMDIVRRAFSLKPNEELQLLLNSAAGAFVSSDEKAQLRETIISAHNGRAE